MTDDNDLTYFLLHLLDVIDRAITELNTYSESKTIQTRALEKKLKGLKHLNHRQRALISHALRHPHHEYTIASHQMSHGVVYQTARTDLLNLATRGLLTMSKIGQTQYFSPVPELEKRLRNMP